MLKKDRPLFQGMGGREGQSFNRGGHTVAGSNTVTAMLAEVVKSYTGVVTVCPPAKAYGSDTWRKRGGSVLGQKLGDAIAPTGHKARARNRQLTGLSDWSEASRFTLIRNGSEVK